MTMFQESEGEAVGLQNMSRQETAVQRAVGRMQVVSLWVLIMLLPFKMGVLQRVAMVAAGLLFVADYVTSMRWRTWRWGRDKWLYAAMMAYYLFIPLWQIWSGSYDERRFSYVMETRLSALSGGLIGLMGFGNRVKARHIAYVMLTACVASSLYIILASEGLSFFAHSLREQAMIFNPWRIELVNTHMSYNLYLNMSLIFAFYLLRQDGVRIGVKTAAVAASVWIFYILCLTDGRIGLATGMLIGAVFALAYTYQRGVKWFLPTVTVYVLLCVAVVSQHKRFEADTIMEHEPRWQLWQASVGVVKESPILGHGVCGSIDRLAERTSEGYGALRAYCERTVTEETRHKLPHPHNAFLEAWSEFGLTGLAVMLFFFVFPLTMGDKRNRLYVAMTVGCYMIQNTTDVFFTLQPLLYILAIILFTTDRDVATKRVPTKF